MNGIHVRKYANYDLEEGVDEEVKRPVEENSKAPEENEVTVDVKEEEEKAPVGKHYAAPSDENADSSTEKADSSTEKAVKMPTKKQLTIAGIVAAIAVIAIVIGVVVGGQQSGKDRFNEYVDSLNTAATAMISGAADAEDACNTVYKVWRSAIFYDSSYEWDDDVKKYYSDDFNEAIVNLYSDTVFSMDIDNIKSNQSLVESCMRELQNPPEGCEAAYEEIKNLYTSYSNLTSLAISPSGSLTDYSDNFSEYDSQVASDMRVVMASIPEKME